MGCIIYDSLPREEYAYEFLSHEEYLEDRKRAASLSDEELERKYYVEIATEGEYNEYFDRKLKRLYEHGIEAILNASYVSYLIDKGVIKRPEKTVEEEPKVEEPPKKKSFWSKLFNWE